MVKTVDDYCDGCAYLIDMHYDNVKSACFYNVIENKRKPCKCGEGCTVREIGERKEGKYGL